MKSWSVILLSVFLCISCTSNVAPMNQKAQEEAQKTLDTAESEPKKTFTPNDLSLEVMHNLTPTVTDKTSPLKKNTFDIAVKSVPVDQFFLNLMDSSGENILLTPGVTGDISLNLHAVTIQDVLNAVRTLYGFEYRETSFGYQIEPRQIETRIFYLSHPNLLQTSESSLSVKSVDLSRANNGDPTAQVDAAPNITSVNTHFGGENFWEDIDSTLANIIKNDAGSYFNTNKNTGVVVISAYRETLEKAAKYLQTIQDINNRQVIIDAKIIELSLYKKFQTGINWTQTGLNMVSNTGSFTISNPISVSNIDSVLTLLSQQGTVNVLSNPRISVTNNRPALIKVGNDSYYVTAVTSGTTPVGTTATVSSDVQLTPFFSGVSLSVIPSITPNGMIKLHIHPAVSIVNGDVKEITLSDTQKLSLPLASSDIRELDSNVEMESGEVIVLGGLMQRVSRVSETSTPGSSWSANHPFHDDAGSVVELVILLKTTLSDEEAWKNEIQNASETYKRVSNEL